MNNQYIAEWHRLNEDAPALAAARARLAARSLQNQRLRRVSNQMYYSGKVCLEETIGDLPCAETLDAVVTRNHYGSLVLNTAHALFIDVDVSQPRNSTPRIDTLLHRRREQWQRVLGDLRTVLSSEVGIGFRIYRTAAGFRILATTHEFEPGLQPAKRLMTAVGADYAFIRLCRTQRTFRARLTPKPWRCGATLPPNSFPRRSRMERQRFTEWLSQYERACVDRATCRFLDHIGPTDMHERIAPVVELHDRETKAFEALQLA